MRTEPSRLALAKERERERLGRRRSGRSRRIREEEEVDKLLCNKVADAELYCHHLTSAPSTQAAA